MKVKAYIVAIILLLPWASYGYGSEWCVQVSTYRNLEGVKQDYGQVKKFKGSRIEDIGGIYALRIGHYGTEDAAKAGLRPVKKEFPNAFVRKCANMPSRVLESSSPVKPAKRTKSAEPSKRVEKAPAAKAAAKPEAKTTPKASAPIVPATPAKPAPVAPQKTPVIPKGKPAETKALPPVAAVIPTRPAVKTPPALPTPKPAPAVPTPVAVPVQPPLPAAVKPAQDLSEPQKVYEEAEKQRSFGNHTQAIDLYRRVIQMSKTDSELAGRASYRIALCYDILGDRRTSDTSYIQAIERWPGLDGAPGQILMDEGMRAYNNSRYEASLKIFAVYLTMYPEDRRRAEYLMALSLMQLGRYNAAMILMSRILEEAPTSREAIECVVAFGNIGMMVPKVKATMFVKGYEFYKDPILAYDTALSMRPDKDAEQRILYTKGCALMNLGRTEDAHRTLMGLLKMNPRRKDVYRIATGINIAKLFQEYYGRQDYPAVIGAYFQATGLEVPMPSDAPTAIMIAKSLKRMGLDEDAVNVLKGARIKASGKDVEEIDKAVGELGISPVPAKSCEDHLKEYREAQSKGVGVTALMALRAADCLYEGKQYRESIPIYRWASGQQMKPDEKRWSLLRVGQANLRLGNAPGAKQAFDELKATGADEFWAKLADFAYEDGKWTEKYGRTHNTKKK